MPALVVISGDDACLQFGGGTTGHPWGNAPPMLALCGSPPPSELRCARRLHNQKFRGVCSWRMNSVMPRLEQKTLLSPEASIRNPHPQPQHQESCCTNYQGMHYMRLVSRFPEKTFEDISCHNTRMPVGCTTMHVSMPNVSTSLQCKNALALYSQPLSGSLKWSP